jgi:hypothetical protein
MEDRECAEDVTIVQTLPSKAGGNENGPKDIAFEPLLN